MRSFTQSVRDQFDEGLHRIVTGICASRGITAEATYTKNYPPVINTEEETAIAAKAAAKVVGEENVDAAAKRIMGSEDFAFMLLKRPGNYIMIGNGDGELTGCMVHNPHYDFNDEILPIGCNLLGRASTGAVTGALAVKRRAARSPASIVGARA